MLGQDAVLQARVLDLYAGTGALGIEALSRGAAWADFVESDARRSRRINESLRELELADCAKVYRMHVERVFNVLPGGYDIVFADPPYASDPWGPLLERLGKGDLLNDGAIVIAEHSPRSELADGYGDLARASQRRYGDTAVSRYTTGASHG